MWEIWIKCVRFKEICIMLFFIIHLYILIHMCLRTNKNAWSNCITFKTKLKGTLRFFYIILLESIYHIFLTILTTKTILEYISVNCYMDTKCVINQEYFSFNVISIYLIQIFNTYLRYNTFTHIKKYRK